MKLNANVRPMGDHALLVELGSSPAVHRALHRWRDAPPAGVEELVPGAETILLIGDPDPLDVLASIASVDPGSSAPPGRVHTISTVYDGRDLAELAEQTGMMVGNLVAAHSASEYLVAFMGFSPGFAYLAGADRRLHVPRRPTPRTSVPAGSVALAAGMTAVYPQATPGGWMLIGRTDAVMFDPHRRDPALLAPGDTVRFHPATDLGDPPTSLLRSVLTTPRPGTPAVEILEPGPLLTVQDGGRFGWRHAGVPVGGAADHRSAVRANLMVGNQPGAALFESTFGSCRLRLRASRRVAITGAKADISVDGLPARPDASLELRPGTEIRIGPCRSGVRVYIAVSGGLDVPPILGSQSTDTLSGLGPPPLEAGHVLALGAPGREVATDIGPPPAVTAVSALIVKARRGPRHDWLSPEGREALERAEFEVGPSSDRTGVRLIGTAVARSRSGELPSEGMVPGAVQVPPDGKPIVLMRNHPPTGGYPAVAVVTDEGIDALAQAPAGTRVRFDLSAP